MTRGIRFLAVGIAIVFMSGMFAAWVSAQDGEPLANPPIVPRSSGSSPKTHVVEVLTGLWCPPCGAADPGLGRIADEWHQDLIVLMYHCCPPPGGADQFWDPAVLAPRDAFYGFKFLPTTVVDGGGDYSDGTLFNIGSGGAAGTYDEIQADIMSRTDPTSNMLVEVQGDLTTSSANVEIRITATDLVTQSNLAVRTVLYEDALFGIQNNGPDVHRYVARALSEQPLTIAQGQTVTKSAAFALNPSWNVNKLGVAAFVQSNDRVSITIIVNGNPEPFFVSDILNAARYDFAPRGILVYRDQGLPTDYVEDYEVLLSTRNDFAFDTWNAYVSGTDTGAVDDRGLPTAAQLAEFPLVIWNAGAASAGVLSASERPLLGGHLDATGNLFITGSNFGFDAWTTYRPWYQQYLHANWQGGDTGDTAVTGIVGDPIGDAFAGVNLNILASPERIDAMVQPGSSVPFKYSGTSFPSGVRSQHDADSRMVYLGFQYFEGTDLYREGVMGQVILWIDGAYGPVVDVLYPDGGEQFAQGAPVTIRWQANDVVMAEDAIDLYFSNNGGTSWSLIAANEPNDGRYAWTIPNIDSSQCRIRVVARDLSTESADGEAQSGSDFICGDPGFRITFTGADLGWRLISFPTILADTTTPVVLSSLTGSYRMVRAFNPTSADPWQAFDPTRVSSDLQYIDNTMAFWIEVTAPGTFDVQGQKPTTTQYVPLRAGWNLVGFPSYRTDYTVAMLEADTGATRVEGFDASNVEYHLRVMLDTEFLRTGEGFWVYVPADTVWMVPA